MIKLIIKNILGFIAFLACVAVYVPAVAILGLCMLLAAKLLKSDYVASYFLNQLYGVDQSANSVMGGDPDETISSRLGRTIEEGARYPWVRFLQLTVDLLAKALFADHDHCKRSINIHEQAKFAENSKEVWNWSK